MQDEGRLPALKQKLTELGMAPSEFPELVYGQDGVIAVSVWGGFGMGWGVVSRVGLDGVVG